MSPVAVPSHMPVDLPAPITVDPTTGRKKVYVNPPVIHIGSGQSQLRDIRFKNNTGDKARLWFPNGAPLFAGPPAGYSNFENPFVIENGKELDLKLMPNLGYGMYEYHVYCDVIGAEADGNSPPNLSCP